MAGELEDLLVQVGEGTNPDRAALTWGIHEGIRGGTWLTVFSDGVVQTRQQAEPEDQVTVHGRVPHEAVRELASTLLTYDLPSLTIPPPQDPAQVLSLAVSGTGVSWQLQYSRHAVEDLPALADVQQTFTRLRDLASAPAPAGPTAIAAPLPVQVSRIFNVTMVVGGLMTCGVVGVMLWVVSRKMPRVMDPTGVTLRNGKRYAWADLSLRKRVASHDESLVMGYDLLAADGVGIRLAEGAFVDGDQVVAYALARMAET